MILIISNDNDITTREVIKWLIFLKKKFLRVNEYESFSIGIYEKRIVLKSEKKEF